MTTWDTYPPDYRAAEVHEIISAVQAGECAAVIGLSGSGKSNLLGFMASRVKPAGCRFVLVDCNRLVDPSTDALFRLIRRSLGSAETTTDEPSLLDATLEQREREWNVTIGLLLDRFDGLAQSAPPALFNNLRALRD